ncbi:MAG TPA: NAD-dependent epimerase/dehydratase family protein [Longimicrobium sp.]
MTETSALIGHTGFVGGNLLRQRPFTDRFNSSNIESIAGREYDLLVCSGARAEKWKANQDPEGDLRGIDRLRDALAGVSARHVVLISTVDVYPEPVEVDEDTPIDTARCHPYGLHRLELERFVAERFPTTIVRLPGVFGTGLKKNIIFDFLHGNDVDKVDSRGVFQFYGLDHLWSDVARTVELGIPLLNVATEPVSVGDVARVAFGIDFDNPVLPKPARYDFRSRHAAEFGGADGYLYDAATTLREIAAFVRAERGAA